MTWLELALRVLACLIAYGLMEGVKWILRRKHLI